MKRLIALIAFLVSLGATQVAMAVTCDLPGATPGVDSRALITWDALPIGASPPNRVYVICADAPGVTYDTVPIFGESTSVSASYTSASFPVAQFGDHFCNIYYTTADGNVSELAATEATFTCNDPGVVVPPIVYPGPTGFSVILEP